MKLLTLPTNPSLIHWQNSMTAVNHLWHPSYFKQLPYPLTLIGVLSLLLFAFAKVSFHSLGSIGETLVIVTGIGTLLYYCPALRRSAPFWLLLAAIAVQVASWTGAMLNHPEWSEDYPKVDRLARWFIFIGVSWWLGGSIRNVLTFWSVALAGLLVTPWALGNGLSEWLSGLSGQRVDFGIRNAQHTAVMFGVALLGLACFGGRAFLPGRLRGFRISLWACLVVTCALAVLVTQTRAVWLASLIAFTFTGISWAGYAFLYSENREAVKKAMIAVGAVLVLLLSLVGFFRPALEARLSAEHEALGELLAGNISNLPFTSIGIRVHSWLEAIPWVQERPILGWGGNGRGLVLKHSETLPQWVIDEFGHLHSSYLEILVNYGLAGVSVFVTLILWLTLNTYRAWRQGRLPGDFMLFYTGFLVFWLIVNAFESYFSYSTGIYIFNLIAGGLVTIIWASRLRTRNNGSKEYLKTVGAPPYERLKTNME